MNISIIYDSKTGITKQAAESMAATLKAKGHQCAVDSIQTVNAEKMTSADKIFLGCWIAGLFIILQHPSKPYREFAAKLPDLSGKQVALFCTYKLAVGKSLDKMAAGVVAKGGQVVNRFKFRGPKPDAAFETYAESL